MSANSLVAVCQALCRTDSIAQYFLSDAWRKDVNRQNPKGKHGKLVESFSSVVRLVVEEKDSEQREASKALSAVLSAPDTTPQVIVDALIQGLGEDTNRVIHAPMFSHSPSDDLRPDAARADDAWLEHRRSMSSVFSELFSGLAKDTIVCPKCHKTESIFRTFSSVSVPIPAKPPPPPPPPVQKGSSRFVLTVHPVDPDALVRRVTVVVDSKATVADIVISVLSQIPQSPRQTSYVVAHVHRSLVVRVFDNSDPVSVVPEFADVHFFEVDALPGVVPLTALMSRVEAAQMSPMFGKEVLFGVPMLIGVSPAVTYSSLCLEVWNRLRPVTDVSDLKRKVAAVAGETKSGPATFKGIPDRDLLAAELFDIEACDSHGMVPFVRSGGTPTLDIGDGNKPLNIGHGMHVAVRWNVEPQHGLIDVKRMTASVEHEEGPPITLDTCLDSLILQQQHLEPWYCNRCKEHHLDVAKRTDLWMVPPILVINLSRFITTKLLRDKITAFVNFPIEGLDISGRVAGKHSDGLYDLIAVVNHYGGLSDGHCTTFAKVGVEWRIFDDSVTSTIRPDSTKTSGACVLFYRLRGFKGPRLF